MNGFEANDGVAAEVKAAAAKAEATFGKVDILINNGRPADEWRVMGRGRISRTVFL